MSILVRYAPAPATTIDQYDEVVRRLNESGEMPADGFANPSPSTQEASCL